MKSVGRIRSADSDRVVGISRSVYTGQLAKSAVEPASRWAVSASGLVVGERVLPLRKSRLDWLSGQSADRDLNRTLASLRLMVHATDGKRLACSFVELLWHRPFVALATGLASWVARSLVRRCPFTAALRGSARESLRCLEQCVGPRQRPPDHRRLVAAGWRRPFDHARSAGDWLPPLVPGLGASESHARWLPTIESGRRPGFDARRL